ncbi:MAG TPA: 3-isopropylmalate dehydratase small subunit [Methylomirabilota bacterium]|nr:3-isopropylmalate dehydratase small subunit [Methylomirabilota bacterium]
MEPFTHLTAVAAPMDLPNIDTDRVIPARFLRRPREAGFGPLLFHDVRFGADGTPRADFVLNTTAYRDAKILVTAENFGCGSSREMAVWALMDYGIRVVIGPSFGDIFFENCFKNGALAVVLPTDVAAGLRRALHERPGATVTVDLPAQTITGPGGEAIRFEIDAFRKQGLLTGQDEVEMTLARLPAIEAFEARRRDEMPWLG